jgi:hypothetical protein
MSWTRPEDLRAQVQKLWDRGALLAALVGDGSTFPLRLALKVPSSTEMIDRFDDVRAWIVELRTAGHCRIDMRGFTHRVFGSNEVPQAVWVDRIEDAFAMIGKSSQAVQFQSLLETTRARQPALLAWLSRRPLRALELTDQWDRLLDVVTWVLRHPRSNIYLRQVDIAGVHSKFIESQMSVLAELLNLAVPHAHYDSTDAVGGGAAPFAARYGFRSKPIRIRFRALDDKLGILRSAPRADIALDAASFAGLDIPAARVFITENETNFLAFPDVPNSVVIFGAGYGWDALAAARWLRRCTVFYWGDIDTHGFAILDQLRGRFEHVESLLMDRKTLLAHEAVWGVEPDQVVHDLPHLNAAEGSLFDELRDNRLRPALRLEQERVTFGWLQAALDALPGR